MDPFRHRIDIQDMQQPVIGRFGDKDLSDPVTHIVTWRTGQTNGQVIPLVITVGRYDGEWFGTFRDVGPGSKIEGIPDEEQEEK